MKTYCCNHCKKMIEPDDIEAIEILKPMQRALFSAETFVPIVASDSDGKQNVHYCGKCKMIYHCEWV
jgi:hypothetical protein